MKIKTLFFMLFFISGNTFAFSLNNNSALVFGQDEVNVNIANIACTNIGIDVYELQSIVGDAVNQYWNKSPTSRLKLRAGSVKTVDALYGTDLICNASTNCVPNSALAVASDILITCNTNTSNFNNTSVLAVTVPNNTTSRNIIGSLIMINDRSNNQFAKTSRAEKVSILAHELGHAIGLGHSPVRDSLMYFNTIDMRQSLGADDIDGITYLYPKKQPATCGSISEKNNPKSWLGLFIGFMFIGLMSKTHLRYLKLRPRV